VHEAGWIAPEQLLERLEVRGRGGTILQPGIDLIERAQDFPANGALLIITDGWCDRSRVTRAGPPGSSAGRVRPGTMSPAK
jgi:predicted metal-dependent peptidase